MSHHFRGPSAAGTVFNFNSDLSGDVSMIHGGERMYEDHHALVPAEDLLAFVDHVRMQYLPLDRSDDRDRLAWELSADEDAPEFVSKDLVKRVVLALEQRVRELEAQVAGLMSDAGHG